jgi:hypothetical protein
MALSRNALGAPSETHRSARHLPLLPVLPSLHVLGYPRHAMGALARYMPLAAVLTSAFATDASFAAYSVPAIRRRLTCEAVEEVDVPIRLLVFDVDDEHAHRADVASQPPWFDRERPKIRELLDAHPGGFVYRTRRGWRVIYQLPSIFLVRDNRDAGAWKVFYAECVDYLREHFDIVADGQCASWAQLFRAPHGTREGERRPENRETIGDPNRVGAWDRVPRVSRDPMRRASTSAVTEVRSLDRYVAGALRAGVELVAEARGGHRNDILNRQAYALARFVVAGELDEETFVSELTSAARYAELGESEIAATVASALTSRRRVSR